MSGLAGVRWHDAARNASGMDIRAPLEHLAHRGPDGLFVHASGPCALGIAQFLTTPEDRRVPQPYRSPSGLVLTLDGRIDNASEIVAALGRSRPPLTADVAVVAAAWEQWGVDALPRLLGDFALAVWDPGSRELALTRDVFGLRPLLYRQHGGAFWWASEVQALARLGDARVNEGVVGEYLTDSIRSETETLVSGISRVPRASVLVLSASGEIRVRRYWTPRLHGVPRRRRDGEVVEEFRAIFSEAVRARLQSHPAPAILLSGGLDSSLIAAEAAAMVQRGEARPVRTFTLSAPGDPSDESPFASAVATHLGVSSTLCPYTGVALERIVDDAERSLELPLAPNCVAAQPLTDALHRARIRVCLNGVGGNEWFSGNHFPFADHLRRLQFVRMATRLWSNRVADKTYRPLADLRLAVWLQLPDGVKAFARRFMRRDAPSWIAPGFAARTDLEQRLRATLDVPALPTMQQRLMFAWATNADKMFFTEYAERVNAMLGSEERMPFLDRRLLEWALALPDDQRWRGGVGKVVLRNVAAPVLPDSIVRRERGPDFSSQTAEGLLQIGGRELVMSIARRRTEWVVPDAVEALFDNMVAAQTPEGRRLGYYSWLLWLLVATHFAADAIEKCAAGKIKYSSTLPQEIVA